MKTPPEKMELRGYVDERLRTLVRRYADEQDAAVSDCIAFLIANALERPDLSEVPSKRLDKTTRILTKPTRTWAASQNVKLEDKKPRKVQLDAYVDSRLLALVQEFAEKERIPVSECVAHLVAVAMKRPDLATVPRKRLGRPRKDQE